MTETFQLETLATPTGRMLILTDGEQRLRAADWADHEDRMRRLLQRHYGDFTIRPLRARGLRARGGSASRRALHAYFEGDLDAIGAIATATNGTDFQRRVWAALRRIRPGSVLSYGALAAELDRPTAARAVGLANGTNPIAIVVPCHRVIGADASLTGYGGGLARKRWLLAHEGAAPR
ncbi:MAG: methylated-DNA--[protein]-cysteine S-methyltransferase [Steroidobacteraceae bacterium]